MAGKSIPPRYLTSENAAVATGVVQRLISDQRALFRLPADETACRPGVDFHIVILVPAIEERPALDDDRWPNAAIKPHVLHEFSGGDRSSWKVRFDRIARSKALQLWTGRNDGHGRITPHLLFSGDAPYFGGVSREGIVVACSGCGFAEWFDHMISGIVADVLLALARHAYERDRDRAGKEILP